MIFLGYSSEHKKQILDEYVAENAIEKVIVLGPAEHSFQNIYENIDYADIIKYVYYYRLISFIDTKTLVVINECLQTKNRYDLTYNCIRNFLNQTNLQLVFNWFPIIENREDFCILYDFVSKSRHKRFSFDEIDIERHLVDFEQSPWEMVFHMVKCSPKILAEYQRQKKKLFDNICQKDPHTIPRNLHLIGWQDKKAYFEEHLSENLIPVVRNNRASLNFYATYKQRQYEKNKSYLLFDIAHNFKDLCWLLSLSETKHFEVLVSDLKVDDWYSERLKKWLNEYDYVRSKILSR